MSDLRSYGQPVSHNALRFCKFCGQHVDAPCQDDTDLLIYRNTVERCSDAAFNREGERHFDGLSDPSTELQPKER